ncbi:Uncharacterized [Moorella glycerini]|uniref:Uncharacterized protein n=1 Tax=Neomoorella stamsii TaxID=1266720 RepID=A0A9X7J207_9FIRM|nr:hypothetical protein MOST_22840 [Moorella stamsii]CEP66903.1 Uncharacterized [Moorella glycerini]
MVSTGVALAVVARRDPTGSLNGGTAISAEDNLALAA